MEEMEKEEKLTENSKTEDNKDNSQDTVEKFRWPKSFYYIVVISTISIILLLVEIVRLVLR